MTSDGITSVLARADRAAALPRLGGMARSGGVVIATERFWAFADTGGAVRTGRMPVLPACVRRIPLLRGLMQLAVTFSLLFGRRGIGRPLERGLLTAALAGSVALVFLPNAIATAAAAALTLALIAWIFRGRTLFLHGAEHRAIAAAEERRLLATWLGQARPSRYAERCGTNFAVLAVATTVLLTHLWPLAAAAYTPFLVNLLALALAMELWRLTQTARRWAGWLLVPGLALQRLTTQEPRHDETQLALTALAAVVLRELDAAATPAMPERLSPAGSGTRSI